MLKQIFHKDVLFIILVNLLFIDFSWQFPFIIVTLLFFTLDSSYIDVIFFYFTILFLILRLTMLPFTYNYMEHNSNNLVVQRFIFKIRDNIMTKIIILCLSLLPTLIYYIFHCENLTEFAYSIPSAIVMSIFCGAFGSYVVLFIYWYIQDHFSKYNIISKILNLLVNKYTFIFSISFIALCYLLLIMSLFIKQITLVLAVLFIALCFITSLLYFINKNR